MKRIYINLAALLFLSLTFSCKKGSVQQIDQKVDANSAQVKFFNFGISSPSINFYANNLKISGTLSSTGTESTTGVSYGSVFPASNYSVLAAGQYTFKGQIPSTASANADLAIATLAGTLAPGKSYSVYTCGFYNTTAKTSDAFMVEDVLPAVAGSSDNAYVRFVNTIPNAAAPLSLYAKNTTTATETIVATSIAYKSGSAFATVPSGVYELYARYASAPTVNVVSRNGTSVVSFVAGRAYTISSRGDITITSSSAATRPFLDNTPNR